MITHIGIRTLQLLTNPIACIDRVGRVLFFLGTIDKVEPTGFQAVGIVVRSRPLSLSLRVIEHTKKVASEVPQNISSRIASSSSTRPRLVFSKGARCTHLMLKMLVRVITAAAFGLLASPVYAGSRLWEASTLGRISNGTMEMERRAISFKPSGGEDGHYTWPDKTIKYCYADDNAKQKLRGFIKAATETTWGALIDIGFKYQEVSLSDCKKDRVNHLMVHYNDEGKLSSSVGKLPINDKWNRENPESPYNGPVTHLSTKENIGMLDVVANVAHELGHVWGLYHEHQNPLFWYTGVTDQVPDDPTQPKWSGYNGNGLFQPSQFNCKAISDYEVALERARKLASEDKKFQDIERTFCSNIASATKIRFSAANWLPLIPGPSYLDDGHIYDPTSLMLYPSGAGGKRPGATPDGRQDVLTLADNVRMMPNVVPSGKDIERLRLLYSSDIADIPDLHLRGPKKSKLDSIKQKLTRFGSAKDKTC